MTILHSESLGNWGHPKTGWRLWGLYPGQTNSEHINKSEAHSRSARCPPKVTHWKQWLPFENHELWARRVSAPELRLLPMKPWKITVCNSPGKKWSGRSGRPGSEENLELWSHEEIWGPDRWSYRNPRNNLNNPLFFFFLTCVWVFILFFNLFLLKNNCFTEFCYFLSNLNMNQP